MRARTSSSDPSRHRYADRDGRGRRGRQHDQGTWPPRPSHSFSVRASENPRDRSSGGDSPDRRSSRSSSAASMAAALSSRRGSGDAARGPDRCTEQSPTARTAADSPEEPRLFGPPRPATRPSSLRIADRAFSHACSSPIDSPSHDGSRSSRPGVPAAPAPTPRSDPLPSRTGRPRVPAGPPAGPSRSLRPSPTHRRPTPPRACPASPTPSEASPPGPAPSREAQELRHLLHRTARRLRQHAFQRRIAGARGGHHGRAERPSAPPGPASRSKARLRAAS